MHTNNLYKANKEETCDFIHQTHQKIGAAPYITIYCQKIHEFDSKHIKTIMQHHRSAYIAYKFYGFDIKHIKKN